MGRVVAGGADGGVPPLTREHAEILLAQAPDWQLPEEAHHIERSFRFRNFREALSFVQEVGELVEAEGHHHSAENHPSKTNKSSPERERDRYERDLE